MLSSLQRYWIAVATVVIVWLIYLLLSSFPFLSIVLVALVTHVGTRAHLHKFKNKTKPVEPKLPPNFPTAYTKPPKRRVKKDGSSSKGLIAPEKEARSPPPHSEVGISSKSEIGEEEDAGKEATPGDDTVQKSVVAEDVDDEYEEYSSDEDEEVFGYGPCPIFPMTIMDKGSSIKKEVYPNWRAPIPIENEWFKGLCVMKLRTEPGDPVFAPYFDGKRRWTELQMQGTFKKIPDGTLYMGVEVPTPAVSMGLMARGVANMLMKLLKSMVPDAHYSFGSKDECPHIVFPIASAMDTFIVTPEGVEPPKIGVDSFPVTDHKQAFTTGDKDKRETYKIGPTYSMSFHSMYLNLTNWKVSNLPGGIKDVSLTSFWGKRPLRLVAYSYMNDDPKAPHKDGPDKRYLFFLECQHLGGDVTWPERDAPERLENFSKLEGHLSDFLTEFKKSKGKKGNLSEKSDRSAAEPLPRSAVSEDETSSSKEKKTVLFKKDDKGAPSTSLVSSHSPPSSSSSSAAPGPILKPSSSTTRERSPPQYLSISDGGILKTTSELLQNFNSGQTPSMKILDVSVPAWIRRGSLIVFVFQFTVQQTFQPTGKMDVLRDQVTMWSVIRTCEEIRRFARALKTKGLNVKNKSLRKRSNGKLDKKREYIQTKFRRMAEVVPGFGGDSSDEGSDDDDPEDDSSCLSDLGSDDKSEAASMDSPRGSSPLSKSDLSAMERFRLFMAPGPTDTGFLSPTPWLNSGFDVNGTLRDSIGMYPASSIKHRGIVVRAFWETHWVEEFAVLTPVSFLSFEYGSKKSAKVTILLRDIVDISALADRPSTAAQTLPEDMEKRDVSAGAGDEDRPFAGFQFFRVETSVNVSYFFVKTTAERDGWVNAIQSLVGSAKKDWSAAQGYTNVTSRKIGATASKAGTSKGLRNSMSFQSTPNLDADLYESDTLKNLYDNKAGELAQPSKRNVKKGKSPSAKKMQEEAKEIHFRRVGKKKVLNGKRLSFLTGGDYEHEPPLKLSSNLLTLVMSLSPDSPTKHYSAFVDALNFLKVANAVELPEIERMAFFLNVFHTLLIHALLVLGPPQADLRRWNSFFNRIAYDIGGHILSLAEIEHCILRAKGSKPKLLAMMMPKWSSSDPRKQFALTAVDARVDVLLNYGSLSCPPFIAKFTTGDVEEQLNKAVAQVLDWSVRVTVSRKQISLSKMMYWYQWDFGSSEQDLIRWILKHASEDLSSKLLALDSTGRFKDSKGMVKYRVYQYSFRSTFERVQPTNSGGIGGDGDGDEDENRRDGVDSPDHPLSSSPERLGYPVQEDKDSGEGSPSESVDVRQIVKQRPLARSLSTGSFNIMDAGPNSSSASSSSASKSKET